MNHFLKLSLLLTVIGCGASSQESNLNSTKLEPKPSAPLQDSKFDIFVGAYEEDFIEATSAGNFGIDEQRRDQPDRGFYQRETKILFAKADEKGVYHVEHTSNVPQSTSATEVTAATVEDIKPLTMHLVFKVQENGVADIFIADADFNVQTKLATGKCLDKTATQPKVSVGISCNFTKSQQAPEGVNLSNMSWDFYQKKSNGDRHILDEGKSVFPDGTPDGSWRSVMKALL